MNDHRVQYVRRALQGRPQPDESPPADKNDEDESREQRQRREQDLERHRQRSQPQPSSHQQQPQQRLCYRRAQPPSQCCQPCPKWPRMVEMADGTLAAVLAADGYRLGSTIGYGSYSKVRKAMRVVPGGAAVPLACKVIDKKRGAGAGASYQLKFLPRELEVLRRVRHANLVGTHCIYVTPSAVYVFMDYCQQGDLLNHLQRTKGIPFWQARTFFRQICDAVDYLHQNNISHRDIKCENVLLESMEVVKMTDFGFARVCEDEWGKRLMSQTYCGSTSYAAPEVLKGIPYDPKAYDVWALGVVLYVMLANCFPFPQSDRQRMVTNQMAKKLSQPNKPMCQEAMELVSIILEPDVLKRITVSQIKSHNWVKEINPFDRSNILT